MAMSRTLIFAVIGGAVGVVAAGGGAAYYMQRSGPSPEELRVAAEAAAHERYVREEEINYATVFSFVRMTGGASQPVMVTLHLAGTRGLGAFCSQLPLVEETVLRALAANGMQARLHDAINRALGGGAVRAAAARPLTNQAAAGSAARDTAQKCRKIAGA